MLLIPENLISTTDNRFDSQLDWKPSKVFTIDQIDGLIAFILGLSKQPSNDHPTKSPPIDRCHFIFWSSRDSQTEKMWCPDCEEMEVNLENVRKYLRLHQTSNQTQNDPTDELKQISADSSEISLVYVYVGDRDQWKSADNPFKKSPWNLTKIPTVLKLSSSLSNSSSAGLGGKEKDDSDYRIVFQDRRLVEKECSDFSKLMQFFSV